MSFFTIFDILNNSKYFSGFIMILMNLGSKYVPLELSEEQEEFLSKKVIRRLLVFAIFFMATRDVLVSIILTVSTEKSSGANLLACSIFLNARFFTLTSFEQENRNNTNIKLSLRVFMICFKKEINTNSKQNKLY